ncbi:Undecaprenyl-diphosphatase [Salinivirga cyanobacteriivorans]|uniref:Undecaprenyl-diphosphatase n=1 Tax=Salinivirga cyanobacteriivorans TaxID=1307839 RepID=A0A0S2HZX3_9BACT|nr:undecaprenyl-diphosphate phosphatase [Salinivirga cyanobacteriivorans]ALO15574.1 Undecaprenyl-diphosphatase [Salinivirga cyanobacteriivorans]
MEWIEALILGLIQGLTEFLPVSSSGHLEIGKHLLGVEARESLMFTVAVHGATVLSTIVVFRQDLAEIISGTLKFQWNKETKYVFYIMVSMVPVAIIGLFFKDNVEQFFGGENLVFVGAMLLVTAALLAFAHFWRSGKREIKPGNAFVIGIAQALAVLPGISRSGATISTGLLLGVDKKRIARFSFLMVLIPILGENFLDLVSGEMTANSEIGTLPLLVGFVAAFVSGWLACRWMINIVKRGKLIWFAVYCLVVGSIAIIAG